MQSNIKEEYLGCVFYLDSVDALREAAAVPFLEAEKKEYDIILEKIFRKKALESNYRRVYITSEDWKDKWINKQPSCWIAFQYIECIGNEKLIAFMRSCNSKVAPSDFSFVAKMALQLAKNVNNITAVIIIGSYHII